MKSFIRKLNMIDDTTWKLSIRKSVSRFLINQGLWHVFIGSCQPPGTALAGLQTYIYIYVNNKKLLYNVLPLNKDYLLKKFASKP